MTSTASSLAISLLIMVTHAWTWAMLMMILAFDLLLSARTRSPRLWSSAKGKVFVASALVGLVFYVIGGGFFTAFRDAVNFGLSWALAANLRSPTTYFNNLQLTLTNYAGGIFSNWLLLALSIVGVLGLRVMSKEARTLLQSWLLSPLLIMVFLSSDVQWRLLFLIPYNILAAIGLLKILSVLRERLTDSLYWDLVLVNIVELSLLAVVGLLLWNNVVRSMVFIAAHF
jgi:hypothetical protein